MRVALRWILAIAASFAVLAAARYACVAAAHFSDSTSWAIAGTASGATLTLTAWWATRDPAFSDPAAHVSGRRSQAITGLPTLTIGPNSTLTNTTIHITSTDGQPTPLAPPPGVAKPNSIVVGDVPQQPPAFQPRTALLDNLYDHAGGSAIAVVYALVGMRGCGKTHTAAACARHRITDKWHLVAWVNADTSATTLNGLAAAAAALGIEPGATQHDTGLSLRHYLETSGHHCLLIFDNASDPATLRPYIPVTGEAHVLVTSTNTATASLGTPIPIDVYTPTEALAYLHERTRLTDQDGADELAEELGCLPLALAQAAALITTQHLDYPTYLDRLRTFPLTDYLTITSQDPYPHNTATAILLAITTVTATGPTGLALPLLNLISLLSPTGTTRDLLHTAHITGALTLTAQPANQASAANHVDAALGHLASASLIYYSLDHSTITAHRLTTRAIREHAAHIGTLSTAITTATTLLTTVTQAAQPPWQHRHEATDLIQHITALHYHLTHLPDPPPASTTTLLGLRRWALWCLNELGDNPTQAIALGQTLIPDYERTLGTDHPDTLTSRHNLANAYQIAGRLAEAITLHERTLADRERILGPDHPETLASRNNLAAAYLHAGQPTEAITLHERTLADRERILGPDHPDTLTSRNNLAAAYYIAGRLPEATTVFERTLGDFERILGPDHPYTLHARNNLATAHLDAGRLAEATTLFDRALTDRERILGPDHPDTLTSRRDLAAAYKAAGQLAEATALYERILTDAERLFGPDHPYARDARNTLTALRHPGT